MATSGYIINTCAKFAPATVATVETPTDVLSPTDLLLPQSCTRLQLPEWPSRSGLRIVLATAAIGSQKPAVCLAPFAVHHPATRAIDCKSRYTDKSTIAFLAPVCGTLTTGPMRSSASETRLRRRAEKAGQSGELAGGSYEIMKTSGVEWTLMFKAADDFARKNGLRKLGDSKAAVSKMAAFYPADEAFRGVRDWLDARGLRRHFPAVNQWCKEMGAEDIIDLIENTEEIAELLGDALNENERAALCGRRFSEGRTS
ncbi:unnamed protein product [Symbiodinium natans]|uniref:Uncharacterized protein n=1 Tax=Symbiodinium natans TaxID=878477 RepID=A0A812LXN1_9DINO|nr:unnamed protein product [Symbiodinium natans]